MADNPVQLSTSGPPETVLDAEPLEALRALAAALERIEGERRDAVALVVARYPRFLDGWARLGELGRDDVEAYAAFRVGYHRGLDRLRANGWRGSGYVRWQHEENRGFLRSLAGLQRMADAIGESDEADRCGQFLRQLDPHLAAVTDVIDRVTALAASFEARADEIAAARRLPEDVVAALRDAGAFSIAAPRSAGGPELSPRAQTEVIETLSRYEASVGWCVMIGSDAPFYSAFLAPDAADELWPTIDHITAGQIPPNGRAEPVEGGYVVNGRWSFGSGCTHADVMVAGCLVMNDGVPAMVGDAPDLAIACAPASSWTVIDNWHTTGLAGSGSNDYEARDLFVPERHLFRFTDPVRRRGPLYGWPGMFICNMPGALGLARRAIDVAASIAAEKMLIPEFVLLRDTSRARLAIAQAEAQLGAARAYVYESLDRLWAELERGDGPSLDVRVAVALSRTLSFRVARDIAESMSDFVGASSIYQSHPLERLVRDAMTMSQHIAAQHRMYEMVGQLRLTGQAPFPLI